MFKKSSPPAAISAERMQYLKQTRRHRVFVNLTRIGILVAFFGLWEIAGRLGWIDPFIMSQPSRILKSLTNLYESGELLMHIGISCLETIAGFLLGTIVGTLIATALWWSSFLSRVLEPYLVVLNALPKVALGPIFIVWVGAGPKAIIIMTLAISLIVTTMEVLNGFMNTEEEKIKLMRVYGANKMQIFTKAVLPSNFATIINSLALQSSLESEGVKCKVLTSVRMEPIGEFYSKSKALEYLEAGFVVIIGGGTSNPYFTTDTASALRGVEIEADILLKGTRVDGVYTADPEKDPTATKYDRLSFDEALSRNLRVMDLTAFTLCKENKLPIVVFDMDTEGNLEKVLEGKKIGTIVE